MKNRAQKREETRQFFEKDGMKIDEGALDSCIDFSENLANFLGKLPPDTAEKIMCDIEHRIEIIEKVHKEGNLTIEKIQEIMTSDNYATTRHR